MQRRMITTIVHAGGEMQADLLPFSQAKARADRIQFFLDLFSVAEELAFIGIHDSLRSCVVLRTQTAKDQTASLHVGDPATVCD